MKIEVSNGEIVDKWTILQIKKQYCTDDTKMDHICRELDELNPFIVGLVGCADVIRSLSDINYKLWLVEDAIRICEKEGDFGDRFVNLARSVYKINDQRFAVKKNINERTGSHIAEVKILPEY